MTGLQIVTLFTYYVMPCSPQAYVANESNTGFPANTLHLGSSIDSVQMNNGNLHIDIPYLGMNGRGINVTGHFVYDSKSWSPMLHCDDDGYGCYAMVQPGPNSSLQSIIPESGYTFNYSYGTGACFDNSGVPDVQFYYDDSVDSYEAEVLPQSNDQGLLTYKYTVLSGVYLEEPDGTKHPFPTIAPYAGGTDPRTLSGSSPNCPNLLVGPAAGYSSDGSQWYLDLSGQIYSNGRIAAYRKDGAQVFNYDPSQGPSQQNFTLKDTNGNYIGYGPPSTGSDGTPAGYNTLVDTLGRTIPLYSPPGYYDSTGNFRGLSITYETVTIQTSSCPTISVNPPIPPGGGTTGGTPLCYESQSQYPGKQIGAPHIIQLPNGETYTIEYVQNSYGQPSSITLPTGAVISYQWSSQVDSGGPILQSRTETVNGVSSTWTYQWSGAPVVQFSTVMQTSSTYLSQVTDPLNNDTTYQCATDQAYTSCVFSDVKYYNGTGSSRALLETVHTDWYSYSGSHTTEPHVITTILNDTGLVAQIQTDWEQIAEPQTMFGPWLVGGNFTLPTGNKTEVREYDYGQGSPGPLLRTTDYRYLHQDNPSTYVPLNIYDRLTAVTVSGSTGTTQTVNSYDTTPIVTQNVNSSAPNHDSSYDSSFTTRGNLTQVIELVDPNAGTSIATKTNYYDMYGNLRVTQDSKQNTTSYSYEDNYLNASGSNCFGIAGDSQGYITGVTNANNETTTQNYYFCTGLLASTTDPNGAITSQTYDLINAPLVTTFPDTGTLTRNYNGYALPLTITTTRSDIANPATAIYDGLGRIQRTIAPSGAIVDTTYDGVGHVTSITNPYYATDSKYLTSFTYDALGRKLLQCQPDNGTNAPCVPGNSYLQWLYSGNAVTYYDEVRNSWRRTNDSLGRLSRVVEPGGFVTTYQYNVSNALLCVDQWGAAPAGQPCSSNVRRSFVYDSLSRLVTSRNPETGAISYSYLNNGAQCSGNVSLPCSKTDSRNITVSFGYDSLNRLTSKTYSGSGVTTLPSAYVYGTVGTNIPFGVGRLVREFTGTSSSPQSQRLILGYDAMGRVRGEQQCHLSNCTSGTPFSSAMDYDLAGNPVSFWNNVHPMGLGKVYDSAGRLLSVGSTISDFTHPANLLSIGSYTAFGAIQTMTLGTNTNVMRTYDVRLRPTAETAQQQ
jgi:YD repeat-containing protein